MARIIFVSEIEPNSWLHWSYKGEATCLRDFRFAQPTERRDLTTSQVRAYLENPGNFNEAAPAVPVAQTTFWRDYFSQLNDAGLPPKSFTQPVVNNGGGIDTVTLPPLPPPNTLPTSNLVARFKADVVPLVEYKRNEELAALLESWRKRLVCIETKEQQFNHWDDDDASRLFSLTSGIGWTSLMLEQCRTNNSLSYIKAGDDSLDFALLNMELNLGISSYSNFFRLGSQDYVKPDGLGIRRADNSFSIIEVKGPQDNGDLYEATLQALLGALAVHAKREMIMKIASAPRGRRPAVEKPWLPADEASLGIYVMFSEVKAVAGPKLTEQMNCLVQACPIVREIAHFVFEPATQEAFTELPPPKVYRG